MAKQIPSFSNLSGYSYSDIRDAAKKLGITSISTPQDVDKIISYIKNPAASFQSILNAPAEYTKPFEFTSAFTPFQNTLNEAIKRDNESTNLRFRPTPITQKPASNPRFTYTDPGDKFAFGMQDLNELRSQGLSDENIRYYASQAPQVGRKAAVELNLAGTLENYQDPSSAPKSNPNYTYTDPGDKGIFGMQDYRELESQGVSEDVMKFIAQGQAYTGPVASRLLGLDKNYQSGGYTPATIEPMKQAATDFINKALNKPRKVYTDSSDYSKAPVGERIFYGDPGDKGVFGMKDYEQLKGQGLTEDDIRSFASTQKAVGPKAAIKMNLPGVLDSYKSAQKSSPSYSYTDPGDKDAFGMKDYEELYGQGVSEDVMRFIASGQKRVGQKAAKLLGIEAR